MNIKLTDNSKEVLEAIQQAAVRALEKCGLTAEGYAKKLPYTPRELRERAYETEKVITFENELMTVDEANKRWQEYQAENNAKSSELTALIAAAKAAVRERYPDETAEETEAAEETAQI